MLKLCCFFHPYLRSNSAVFLYITFSTTVVILIFLLFLPFFISCFFVTSDKIKHSKASKYTPLEFLLSHHLFLKLLPLPPSDYSHPIHYALQYCTPNQGYISIRFQRLSVLHLSLTHTSLSIRTALFIVRIFPVSIALSRLYIFLPIPLALRNLKEARG